jgi:large subunit ribosomal protein L5
MIYTPTEINKLLTQVFGKKKNFFSLPRLNKVVLNYRVAEARESAEALAAAEKELMAIAGQKPKLTRSKKSISTFKLRQNDPLALKVTLRGKRMYQFVEKLFNLVLPQLRDFRGMSNSAFDQSGNYSLTIHDQTYFPEVNLNNVSKIRSLEITLNITATSIADSKMLLSTLGFPFQKQP